VAQSGIIVNKKIENVKSQIKMEQIDWVKTKNHEEIIKNWQVFDLSHRLNRKIRIRNDAMIKHKIKFLPYNKEITVEDGENLIRAVMEAGVHINASCGGEGVCGKCRVIIEDGDVGGGITEKLSKEDLQKGYRQACLASVQNDLVVRIPIESDLDAGVLNLQQTPRRTARIW